MEAFVLAHCVGIVGECLNFLGAVVLAGDLFFRGREHAIEKTLRNAGEWAARNNLTSTTYKGVIVSSPDFARKVLHLRSAYLGYVGTGLLALGFLFLVLYHSIELASH